MRRITVIMFLVLGAIALSGVTGSASVFKQGEKNLHISNLHAIDHDLYVATNLITIDGKIDGDLFAAAETITVNGLILGSTNVGCYKFVHTGMTEGSIRTFCNIAEIGGKINNSVLFFGEHLTVNKSARIGRDIDAFGSSLTVHGKVLGNTRLTGKRIHISGQFGGDVEIKGKSITISAPAVIKGDLIYSCRDEEQLNIEPAVEILGEIIRVDPEEDGLVDESSYLSPVVYKISTLLAAFLFGLLAIALFRRYADESVVRLRANFGLSFAVGSATIIVFIFAVMLLLVSVITALVGVGLINGDHAVGGSLTLILSILAIPIASFASVAGGVLLYSGKIVLAFLIAGGIFRSKGANTLSKVRLLLGLILLTLLFSIPYLGWIAYFVTALAGAGAIVLSVRDCHRKAAETPTTEPPKRILPDPNSTPA